MQKPIDGAPPALGRWRWDQTVPGLKSSRRTLQVEGPVALKYQLQSNFSSIDFSILVDGNPFSSTRESEGFLGVSPGLHTVTIEHPGSDSDYGTYSLFVLESLEPGYRIKANQFDRGVVHIDPVADIYTEDNSVSIAAIPRPGYIETAVNGPTVVRISSGIFSAFEISNAAPETVLTIEGRGTFLAIPEGTHVLRMHLEEGNRSFIVRDDALTEAPGYLVDIRTFGFTLLGQLDRPVVPLGEDLTLKVPHYLTVVQIEWTGLPPVLDETESTLTLAVSTHLKIEGFYRKPASLFGNTFTRTGAKQWKASTFHSSPTYTYSNIEYGDVRLP